MSFLRRGAGSAHQLPSPFLSDEQAWAHVSSALASHEQRLAVLRVLGPADPTGVTRPPWPTPGLLFVTDRSLLLGLQAGTYVWLAFCISLDDIHAFQIEDQTDGTSFDAVLTVDSDTGSWRFDLSVGSATPTGRAEVLRFIDVVNLAAAARSGRLTPAWALG